MKRNIALLITVILLLTACGADPKAEPETQPEIYFEDTPHAPPYPETEPEIQPEISLIDYTIISGTYANGDIPIPGIPFITYTLSVPDDWAAEIIEYGSSVSVFYPNEGEVYYSFSKGDVNLFAASSYEKAMIDYHYENSDKTMLEFNGYEVMFVTQQFNQGYMYSFYIVIGESYCLIRGVAPEFSEELKEEFLSIVKTFKVI